MVGHASVPSAAPASPFAPQPTMLLRSFLLLEFLFLPLLLPFFFFSQLSVLLSLPSPSPLVLVLARSPFTLLGLPRFLPESSTFTFPPVPGAALGADFLRFRFGFAELLPLKSWSSTLHCLFLAPSSLISIFLQDSRWLSLNSLLSTLIFSRKLVDSVRSWSSRVPSSFFSKTSFITLMTSLTSSSACAERSEIVRIFNEARAKRMK